MPVESIKISVIIPSFNQGAFLEETLLSVINQNYPYLELIVIDGGSTDNSIEIIKQYETSITYWVSEKDNGQSHAINKGLKVATGEWIAWMNSDDCYLPGAFHSLRDAFNNSEIDFIYGNTCRGNTVADSEPILSDESNRKSLADILKFCYSEKHIIPSQSVFIRKRTFNDVGFLNEQLHYCMDLDWYARIYIATDKIYFTNTIYSFYRIHENAKTVKQTYQTREEAIAIARLYSEKIVLANVKKDLIDTLNYTQSIHQVENRHISNLLTLLKLWFKYGKVALQHPRFRILLKKNLHLS